MMSADTETPVEGMHLVAGKWEKGTGGEFASHDPHTGQPSGRVFREADPSQIERAVVAAAKWVTMEGFASAATRQFLLVGIADALDSAAEQIVPVAARESGLGATRLAGELARTTGQLRAFANSLADGYHLERVTDTTSDGTELLRANVPIGPVVVFEASNFPLAFATMGGDTAAALAAGCPVVVKAHPDHPETSELVAQIAVGVLRKHEMDEIFSVLHGPSQHLGASLVQHPEVAAVGFTGSLRGGRALFDLAASRPTPIPVYAEMGSVNPLVVTESAASERADPIAQGYAASLLLGCGQFCTKPGLLLLPSGPDGDRLVESVSNIVGGADAQFLLDGRIQEGYRTGVEELKSRGGRVLAIGDNDNIGFSVAATLIELQPPLGVLNEVFGPAGIVVRYQSTRQLVEIISELPGALAAGVHASADDPDVGDILSAVALRVGRVVWNGFPTGVAVSPAMMHGGPYPATTDPVHTSVGLKAMRRFQRPVTLQDVPAATIPAFMHK